MFSSEQTASLGADLDRRHVATRAQAGRQLSYIEGWHAIAEANRIFGFDGWQSETVALSLATTGERQSNGRTLQTCTYTARCRITVFAAERVIVREGVGAGHGMDQDAGQAHEKAIKEAETDARKRALMTFGNQFGLALYDKTQANVSDDVAHPAPPSIARQIPTVAPDAERTAPELPARGANKEPAPEQQRPTAKPSAPAANARPYSMQVSNAHNGKLQIYYTGLAKGAGNLASIKLSYERWRAELPKTWGQMTERDQKRVQVEAGKVAALIAEHEAAKSDRVKAPSPKTEDVIDPATGELSEAAA